MPDPALAWFGKVLSAAPASLRGKLMETMRAGAEDIRAGRPPADLGDDVPVSELLERQQADNRRAALRAAVPEGRVDTVKAGLACLNANDQHPGALREWLANPAALTAILVGPTGSGKTQAAYATAVESVLTGAAMRGRDGQVKVRPLLVRAWTVNGYMAELRPDGSPDPVWSIRDRARIAELLVLDDLGAEYDSAASQHVRTELGELLSYRLDRDLRTIFTTNLRSKVLKDKIGAPLMSRLAQQCTVLEFTGPDRRAVQPLDW